MTEHEYNKATKIMKEIDKIKKEIEELPRIIVNPREYKETNHKYGYVRRNLARIMNKFVAYTANLNISSYGDMKMICELTEEDLSALVNIRENRLNELRKELGQLGSDTYEQ